MTKHPQLLRNVRMATKMDPSDVPQVREAVRDAEAELGDNGRVLLRPSGTEPVVRVMVEGRDADQVRDLVDRLAGSVENAMASTS